MSCHLFIVVKCPSKYTVFKTDEFLTQHITQIKVTPSNAKVINPTNEKSKMGNALILLEQGESTE